jgi:hypothetical protein
MGKQAAIKGSIVANHTDVLRKCLEREQPSDQALARHFEPGDLDVLRGEIDATGWYDVELYRRMMEFLREVDGDGADQYLVDAGRRSAEKLIEAGIHAQLEYLGRTQHADETGGEERSAAFGRDLRLLASITASILNFSEVQVVRDDAHPLRWVIQHESWHPYPEILCWTTQGFVNRMAEEHDAGPDLWSWQRTPGGSVRFTMSREI